MPIDYLKTKSKYLNRVPLWAPVHEIESTALDQIRNICTLPWVAKVAVMADCHYGKGATVGSVIGLRGAVSPAAVGVDIGCGMAAVKTSLNAGHLPDNLKSLRSAVESVIPVGNKSHEESPALLHKGRLPKPALFAMGDLVEQFSTLTDKVHDLQGRAVKQFGTLGGGNHFIELCLDEEDNVWIMLHSGSRHIGKRLADYHIAIAKQLEHNQALEDRELAVFLAGTEQMQRYRHDLYWAQSYAHINRMVMLDLYKSVLRDFWPDILFDRAISCHHNYVAEENHFGEELFVTRKGAIRAREGDMGIIPGSMGARSFIVKGKGNADSLTSASHGAGRKMSRNQAKKMFTVEDLEQQTAGIECRKDAGVVDEIPGAYKDIEQIIAQQSDLVEVVARLRQVLCVKG